MTSGAPAATSKTSSIPPEGWALVLGLALAGCGGRTELGVRNGIDAGVILDASGAPSLCGIVADSGGGACGHPTQAGLTCCGRAMVNLHNDPLNCGACGHRCGPTEMCRYDGCQPATCKPSCGRCQVCCFRNSGPIQSIGCVDGPACPVGCPECT